MELKVPKSRSPVPFIVGGLLLVGALVALGLAIASGSSHDAPPAPHPTLQPLPGPAGPAAPPTPTPVPQRPAVAPPVAKKDPA